MSPRMHPLRMCSRICMLSLHQVPDQRSKICFDRSGKATNLSGKTFEPGGKDFDDEKHYGKTVFAYRVVAARAERINFGKFRPLLARIVEAIEDFRDRG